VVSPSKPPISRLKVSATGVDRAVHCRFLLSRLEADRGTRRQQPRRQVGIGCGANAMAVDAGIPRIASDESRCKRGPGGCSPIYCQRSRSAVGRLTNNSPLSRPTGEGPGVRAGGHPSAQRFVGQDPSYARPPVWLTPQTWQLCHRLWHNWTKKLSNGLLQNSTANCGTTCATIVRPVAGDHRRLLLSAIDSQIVAQSAPQMPGETPTRAPIPTDRVDDRTERKPPSPPTPLPSDGRGEENRLPVSGCGRRRNDSRIIP
jgi:hypothetical protein